MSMTKLSDNSFEYECDTCGRKPEIYFGDFYRALSDAKADGWRVYKVNGAWCHRCPECTKEKTVFGKSFKKIKGCSKK